MKLSRRFFLGAALAAFGRDAMGLPRFHALSSVASPGPGGGFGPASSWNGTPGSGFSDNGGSGVAIPVDPTRTTGKPILKWWTVNRDRFNTDFPLGVEAFCDGGVASIDLFVEGTVKNITVKSVNTTIDPRGATRTGGAVKIPGYWATIKAAIVQALIAAGTFGGMDCYARANPVDPTMQARVIGPLRLYGSTLGEDWTGDVGAGQTYATVEAALTGARLSGKVHRRILCHNTAAYTWPFLSTADTTGLSWTKVETVPGAVVTLNRSGPPNYNGGNDLAYDACNYLMLGAGLVLDFRYCASIYSFFVPLWLNGCRLTNSVGTVNTGDYNRNAHPQGIVATPESYITFCVGEHMTGLFDNALAAFGNQIADTTTNPFNLCTHAAYNYISSVIYPELWKIQPAFNLHYSGAAATAVATFSGAGNNTVLHLTENGTDVATYALNGQNTGPWFKIEDIVADINANRAGWAAIALSGVATLQSVYLWAPPGGFPSLDGQAPWPYNTVSNTDCKNATVTFATAIDYHVDIVNWPNDKPYENILYLGNVTPNIDFSNPWKGDPGNIIRDVAHINCCYHSAGPQYQIGGLGGSDHCVMDNISFATTDPTVTTGGFHVYDALNASTHCSVRQYAGYLDNGAWGSSTPLIDSYVLQPATGAAVNGANNTGNTTFNVQGGTPPQLFVDPANGDFRPNLSGPLPSHTKVPVQPYSALGNARPSPDVDGAFSLADSAPNWYQAA